VSGKAARYGSGVPVLEEARGGLKGLGARGASRGFGAASRTARGSDWLRTLSEIFPLVGGVLEPVQSPHFELAGRGRSKEVQREAKSRLQVEGSGRVACSP